VEERYIQRFTPAMLAEALAHYAGAPDTAQDLGASRISSTNLSVMVSLSSCGLRTVRAAITT